jgi:hypothetical protein
VKLGKQDSRKIESRCSVEPEGRAKLLHYPSGRRRIGHIEVENATARVRNREPRIDNTKSHRRHNEEIHHRDCIAVVAQESDPALDRIGRRRHARQIARDGSLGDDEAEHP